MSNAAPSERPSAAGQMRSQLGSQAYEGRAAVAGRGVGMLTRAFFASELADGSLIQPFDIVGSDGNVWFSEHTGNRIGRITPRGELAEFAIPTPSSQPRAIALGADGNIWFGMFAAGNPTQFNRADGAGYDFVAEMAVTLDRTNPQVAARLLGSFKMWRMLEPVRRDKAEAALNRVAAAGGLSRDLADIVERSLA